MRRLRRKPPSRAPAEPPTPDSTPATKRKGHGRRGKPKDLPRRREEIDLSEAEKVCPCCGTAKIRIGQSTSERLDYQPMAISVRELVRPTYACRSCEQQAHDPQIAKAALPPEPIPKSGIGAGLLAYVIRPKDRRSLATAPSGVDPGSPRLGRASFDPLRPFSEVR